MGDSVVHVERRGGLAWTKRKAGTWNDSPQDDLENPGRHSWTAYRLHPTTTAPGDSLPIKVMIRHETAIHPISIPTMRKTPRHACNPPSSGCTPSCLKSTHPSFSICETESRSTETRGIGTTTRSKKVHNRRKRNTGNQKGHVTPEGWEHPTREDTCRQGRHTVVPDDILPVDRTPEDSMNRTCVLKWAPDRSRIHTGATPAIRAFQ